MKHDQLYRIIEPHAPIGLKYFTFLNEQLPSIKAFKSAIGTEALKAVLDAHFPEHPIDYIEHSRLDSDADFVTHFVNIQLLAVLKEGWVMEVSSRMIIMYHNDKVSASEIEALWQAVVAATDKENERLEFFMIKRNTYHDFELVEFKIKKRGVSLEDHYNDDLGAIHAPLASFLEEKNSNGVVLFHGNPGTGKTSYIRHLISHVNRRFIYIPNSLFSHLMDPEFISFISSHPESIVILEDCEELLRSRIQQTNDTGLSNLLNLGDGLLGDALKLKIICTFNCELGKIDEAMLRKGRLAFRYSFEPLAIEKTNKLLSQLGHVHVAEAPMTLSDIFNFEHENNGGDQGRTVIGF
jgi:hypothetical protein